MHNKTITLIFMSAIGIGLQQINYLQAQDSFLTFKQAVQLTLKGNPQLKIFTSEFREAEGEIVQSGLRTNPEIGFELENFAGSGEFAGFDSATATIYLSKTLERSKKLKARKNFAIAKKNNIQAEYELMKRKVMLELATAFIQVLAEQKFLVLKKDLAKLYKSFMPSLERRVEAGKVAEVEKIRIELALRNAELGVEQAEANLQIAKIFLASIWGETGGNEIVYQDTLGKLSIDKSIKNTRNIFEKLNQHPVLKNIDAKIFAKSAELRLANVETISDPTLSIGARHFRSPKNEKALVLNFSVPLPILNKNQGKKAMLRASLEKLRLQKKSQLVLLKTKASTILKRIQVEQKALEQINDKILPKTNKAFGQVKDAYNIGKLGFLDIIDSQKTLYEISAKAIEHQSNLSKYHARLAILTGSLPQF